ncbi:uncharacterized protein ASPGLDRAFT_22096 [Aspergillus glaucus CBS 516.65]|uniref:Uncharacterized protein n=1 Tax=Aspergillus glaucus CBS 516.65 TaxID=1160497 RepID=A0A1L9VXF7_ASPGL|nr:hypothetical protein ASPGLDRAFT_22096 [Aspergillus glaucus CBS 516.65]OJJ88585.1 hypothetical protein ASPGLDRAFT_22096 [Aspergillus glaucus CBS 516.65]
MQEGSKKWQGRLDSTQVASTPRRTRSKSSCHLALLSTANDDAWISRSLHALQRLLPKSSVARLSGILHPVESGTDAVQVRAALIRIRTFLCVNGGPVFPECSTDAVKELLGSQCARALNHFPRHYDQQMKQEETSTTSTPEYIVCRRGGTLGNPVVTTLEYRVLFAIWNEPGKAGMQKWSRFRLKISVDPDWSGGPVTKTSPHAQSFFKSSGVCMGHTWPP